MSSPRNRRHSPGVYRRRRLVLLLVVLLVVAGLVWLFVAQPWRGAASVRETPKPTVSTAADAATSLPVPTASAPTPDPAATDTPAPTEAVAETPAAETPAPEALPAAVACTAADVTVDAVADQSTYPAGQNPKLTIRLTNHTTTGCTLNVGTTTQSFTITSGSDTWWRSTDCQSEPSDMTVLIAGGQTVSSSQPVDWDRTRSSVSTCDAGDRQSAAGGGASYHLAVSIGGIDSTSTAQFLLY